ncbi:MAG: ferritin-like domain-containing protein [Chitinophagales bacterium]
MSEFHEPAEELSKETRNYRRALNTLQEEVEAIDWYQQRMDACDDEQLFKILEHNRNEEMEHASMTIEWLRRNQPGWDKQLRTYLFTEGDITSDDLKPESSAASNKKDDDGSLKIGKIKK